MLQKLIPYNCFKIDKNGGILTKNLNNTENSIEKTLYCEYEPENYNYMCGTPGCYVPEFLNDGVSYTIHNEKRNCRLHIDKLDESFKYKFSPKDIYFNSLLLFSHQECSKDCSMYYKCIISLHSDFLLDFSKENDSSNNYINEIIIIILTKFENILWVGRYLWRHINFI